MAKVKISGNWYIAPTIKSCYELYREAMAK